jgi:AcrR family transcriptional regulator
VEGQGPDLPAGIAAAWGRRVSPAKGPRPALSLERIVEAGIAVAADEGLGAVSMGRVARRLGVSAMGLYRYVDAKDELLALMVDAALGVPPEHRPGEDWRDALARWAWGYHDALRRHPWVVQVPITAPPVTPNLTLWMERGLAALGETGLGEPRKLSVMLLLSGFVRNDAALTADLGPSAGETQIMPAWGTMLRLLTDAERFPALHAALASEAFAADDDPDEEFAFGLERLLDGVAALVDGGGG